MPEKQSRTNDGWPVSWEASRRAQLLDMAKVSPVQRLDWLEQALRVALASGALIRAESREQRRRRGLE
jgi:hypothetical protein